MTLLAAIYHERAQRICPERYGIHGPIVMTMRWGLEIRRAPFLTRLSRTVLDGRADNSQGLIETDRTADPLTVRGDRRGCRPIHTDRRGEVCGNRGATIVRPVGRERQAWRDCSSSRGWRSWWRTLAKSGCSTWTRHGCSRHRQSPRSICSTARFGTRAGGRPQPQVTATRQTLECRGSRGEVRRQTGLALSPSQKSPVHCAAR
jgi:hypothetical protein